MFGISVVEAFLVSLCQSELWFRACQTIFIKEIKAQKKSCPCRDFHQQKRVTKLMPGHLVPSSAAPLLKPQPWQLVSYTVPLC